MNTDDSMSDWEAIARTERELRWSLVKKMRQIAEDHFIYDEVMIELGTSGHLHFEFLPGETAADRRAMTER